MINSVVRYGRHINLWIELNCKLGGDGVDIESLSDTCMLFN